MLPGMDGGKFKRQLSEVNTRAVSRRQNELVGKFKMAAGDKVNIRGQVMEHTYIPTGIKRELGEIWCGLQQDGVSRRGYWKRNIILIADRPDELQRLLYNFHLSCLKFNMKLSIHKTKAITISKEPLC